MNHPHVDCPSARPPRVALAVLGLLLSTCAPVVGADPVPELTAEQRTAVLERVCSEISRVYPFPEARDATRDGLLAKLRAGGYDDVRSPEILAARVTEDMEALSRDRHLDLYFDPVWAAEIAARDASEDTDAGMTPSQVEAGRWENFGFKQLRVLGGRVGYLDLRAFYPTRHAGSTAVAAMEFLSGSNAIIVDLRRNGGGWDDMVTLLAAYFLDFEEPKTVGVSRSTLDGSYFVSEVPAFVPGPKLTGIPVYILTSSSTASAAEAFASIMRHLGGDVLLVGETTAGAENPVETIALDGGFVLKIPCYQKLDFGTRKGWEGTGLEPDIEVDAEDALETAHLHALRTLETRLAGEVAREKLRWAIDGYLAVLEPHLVPRSILQSLSGAYRGARVTLDGGSLLLQFEDRKPARLLAISDTTFAVDGRDDLRIRFVTDGGRVEGLERIYSDGYRALHPRE